MKKTTKRPSPATPDLELRKRDWWWRHCSLLSFESDKTGYATAAPGAEFWFDTFWKPRESSIWGYELCRRLVRLTGRTGIDPNILVVLGELPAYPELTALQQTNLALAFDAESKSSPLAELTTTEGWAKGDIRKLCDWLLVEVLDLPPVSRQDPHFYHTFRRRRENSVIYAKRYVPLVLAAVTATTPLGVLRVPGHDLTGFNLDGQQLRQCLLDPGKG